MLLFAGAWVPLVDALSLRWTQRVPGMLSNPKGCFRVGSRVGLRLGLVFCSLVLVLPGRAQRVDVPLFDAQGNFRSTRVQGHRGVDQ